VFFLFKASITKYYTPFQCVLDWFTDSPLTVTGSIDLHKGLVMNNVTRQGPFSLNLSFNEIFA